MLSITKVFLFGRCTNIMKHCAYFDQILTINSTNAKALNNKGLALLGLQKNEEAIQFFDRVFDMNPSDVYALINRGGALLALEKNEEAIQDFDRVISMNA